jgi:hypothetical protein
VQRQADLPLLYSLQSFRYVDLILAPAERAAWKSILRSAVLQTAARKSTDPALDATAAACTEGERRAKKLYEWRMPADPLLDIALDNLTLARSLLYREITFAGKSELSSLQTEIRTALTKLRKANQINYLPLALLTAALYAGTLGEQPNESRHYLAEAQQIAERGPMPLYLADVHLHRARLFRDKAELAKARALIEKHGYWRRKEELEDAEAAL